MLKNTVGGGLLLLQETYHEETWPGLVNSKHHKHGVHVS